MMKGGRDVVSRAEDKVFCVRVPATSRLAK